MLKKFKNKNNSDKSFEVFWMLALTIVNKNINEAENVRSFKSIFNTKN